MDINSYARPKKIPVLPLAIRRQYLEITCIPKIFIGPSKRSVQLQHFCFSSRENYLVCQFVFYQLLGNNTA